MINELFGSVIEVTKNTKIVQVDKKKAIFTLYLAMSICIGSFNFQQQQSPTLHHQYDHPPLHNSIA